MKYFEKQIDTDATVLATTGKDVVVKYFVYGYGNDIQQLFVDIEAETLLDLNGERFPKLWDSLNPLLDPALTVQLIRTRFIGPEHLEAEVYYSYPRSRGGNNTFGDPQPIWELGVTSQRIFNDLDNGAIGDVEDPDGELGVDIKIPTAVLRLVMPRPCILKPAVWGPLVTRVNDATWYGCAPGYAQYLGPEAHWIGPLVDNFEVHHMFEVGAISLKDRDGKLYTATIEHAVWWTFERQFMNDPLTGEQFIARIPVKPNLARVYLRGDFSQLLVQ